MTEYKYIQKPSKCRQEFCGGVCDKFTADRFGDNPDKCPYYVYNKEIYNEANVNRIYNQAISDVLNCVEWDGYTLDIKKRIENLKR